MRLLMKKLQARKVLLVSIWISANRKLLSGERNIYYRTAPWHVCIKVNESMQCYFTSNQKLDDRFEWPDIPTLENHHVLFWRFTRPVQRLMRFELACTTSREVRCGYKSPLWCKHVIYLYTGSDRRFGGWLYLYPNPASRSCTSSIPDM